MTRLTFCLEAHTPLVFCTRDAGAYALVGALVIAFTGLVQHGPIIAMPFVESAIPRAF